jgi:hypothetical protein
MIISTELLEEKLYNLCGVMSWQEVLNKSLEFEA